MKRIILALLALVLGVASAEATAKVPKFQVGFDSITFGWPSVDAKGGVTSSFGINVGLGITYRSYFEPLYPESGALYWEAGTVILLDPFVGIGYDYRFNENLYVGGGVTFFPLHLVLGGLAGGGVGVGLSALYSIFPNVHLGVYLY